MKGNFRNTCPFKEGDVLDAECINTGEKGDGIFKVDGFVVIVPNTEVGQWYKINIKSIRNTVAFGELVSE